MRMPFDKWVPFRNEGTVIRCRVFLFPHAGGTAAFYRLLRRFMPPEIDLCPLELPGRATRLEERPLTSMSSLIEHLRHTLQPLMEVPFGFFGHSVGACMAYEAARQLRSVDGRTAMHLFVSGRGSPDLALAEPSVKHLCSDHDLVAVLSRFGGTPAAVMQRFELVEALLPALRADLELVERYAVDRPHRIPCPISAFGGADDVFHSASLQSWRDFADARFRICILPGGHFYFLSAAEVLAKELTQDLRASMSMAAAASAEQ
jgi:medium-chain acyl-[acyl-carrier-protein] hydrolase